MNTKCDEEARWKEQVQNTDTEKKDMLNLLLAVEGELNTRHHTEEFWKVSDYQPNI